MLRIHPVIRRSDASCPSSWSVVPQCKEDPLLQVALKIHGWVIVRGRAVGVITDFEDVGVLTGLTQDEAELTARLLAGTLAIRLAQLTALGANKGLAVLILDLVARLAAQGTADGDTDSLTRLLGGAQGGALVAMLLGPQVDVVEQTLKSLLSAEVGTELHAQGRVSHVGGITFFLVLILLIVVALYVAHLAGVVHSQLQTLLGEVDLVLQVLLALHQAVVELILAVHHELSQLEQLGNTVLEALEATTVNHHLAIGVGRTARTVGVWGGRLLLLSNLLLHSGSSSGLLVKGCQVWIHTAENLKLSIVLKLK